MEKSKSKTQKFGEIIVILFVVVGVLFVALEMGNNVVNELQGVYDASTSSSTNPLPLATIPTDHPTDINSTPSPEIIPTIDLENFNVEN